MADVYQKEDILYSNIPKTPIEHKFKMVILCVCVRENMSKHLCSSTCNSDIVGMVRKRKPGRSPCSSKIQGDYIPSGG